KQARLQEQLKKSGRQMSALEKKTNDMIVKLERDVASYTLSILLEDIEEKYKDIPEIRTFLSEMKDDMLENLSLFRGDDQKRQDRPEFPFAANDELKFRKYKVNVFVD